MQILTLGLLNIFFNPHINFYKVGAIGHQIFYFLYIKKLEGYKKNFFRKHGSRNNFIQIYFPVHSGLNNSLKKSSSAQRALAEEFQKSVMNLIFKTRTKMLLRKKQCQFLTQ